MTAHLYFRVLSSEILNVWLYHVILNIFTYALCFLSKYFWQEIGVSSQSSHITRNLDAQKVLQMLKSFNTGSSCSSNPGPSQVPPGGIHRLSFKKKKYIYIYSCSAAAYSSWVYTVPTALCITEHPQLLRPNAYQYFIWEHLFFQLKFIICAKQAQTKVILKNSNMLT